MEDYLFFSGLGFPEQFLSHTFHMNVSQGSQSQAPSGCSAGLQKSIEQMHMWVSHFAESPEKGAREQGATLRFPWEAISVRHNE